MIELKQKAKKLVLTSVAIGATMQWSNHKMVKAEVIPITKNLFQTEQVFKLGDRGKQALYFYKKNNPTIANEMVDEITLSHPISNTNRVPLNKTNLQKQMITTKNDPRTVKLLSSTTIKQSSSKLHQNLVLKQGDQNNFVKTLQKLLEKYGYYSGIDGIFGVKTKLAVINFQRNHHLHVDGIAGPETINYLLNSNEIIPFSETNTPNETTTTSNDFELISLAKQYLGVPYAWGGTSPNGFDCSGYIQYLFKQKGISTPRTVLEIWNYASHVDSREIGDLVFFTTYQSGPSHIGIYIGENNFIHASSSKGVTISNLTSSYWSSRYLGSKRIPY